MRFSLPKTPKNLSSKKAITSQKEKKKFRSEHKSCSTSPIIKIYESQPYVNVLKKLIRTTNLKEFVEKSSEFIQFEEAEVMFFVHLCPTFQENHEIMLEVGRHLKSDGAFLKHYCSLLEQHRPEDKSAFRKYMYKRYYSSIMVRENIFNNHFSKEESKNYIQENELSSKIVSNIFKISEAKEQKIEKIKIKFCKKDIPIVRSIISKSFLINTENECLIPEIYKELKIIYKSIFSFWPLSDCRIQKTLKKLGKYKGFIVHKVCAERFKLKEEKSSIIALCIFSSATKEHFNIVEEKEIELEEDSEATFILISEFVK